MNNRTIFIGDIHGCYNELKLLINKLGIKKKDKIYFVGDYINKGPKSFKVLKFFYKNREQFSGVLGNHDYFFLQKIEKNLELNKFEQKLYNKLKENPDIFNFFKNLPLYIENDNFTLIHGGLNFDKKLEHHNGYEITTIRNINKDSWYNFYNGTKKIIYGHWAAQGINIRNNVIGLDSGCCYGGYLSAYTLETGELIQQAALDKYVQINYPQKN